MDSYKEQAKAARLKVLDMIYKAKSCHIGSNLSVIDILTVLFANLSDNDQIVLSAGWKAASFYYFLAQRGSFEQGLLDTYNQESSSLIGLTEPGVPGVLFAGGSMQMGLPAAVGFALAKKIKGEEGRVFCIISDGELAGGMIWESSLISAHHKLDNLTVLVDCNEFQAMGKTKEILDSYFPDRGWDVQEVDGHDHTLIDVVLNNVSLEKPSVILCNTIKGKGVSFMERNNFYHYKDLDDSEYERAKAELS